MFVVMFRAILLYALIILALRLMGKRQLGELQPSELVITILVSNIASIPIEDSSLPMALSVIPILTLVVFEVGLTTFSLKNKRFRTLLSGNPMIIIENGTVSQKAMKKLRYTIDDLMEALRAKDIFNIEDVHYAIVETNGQISVLLKHPAQTVTAEMLELKGKDPAVPNVVVSDGRIIHEALHKCKLGLGWLERTVKENNFCVRDIFLMTADDEANYYIIPRQVQEKQNG